MASWVSERINAHTPMIKFAREASYVILLDIEFYFFTKDKRKGHFCFMNSTRKVSKSACI